MRRYHLINGIHMNTYFFVDETVIKVSILFHLYENQAGANCFSKNIKHDYL